VNEVRRTQPPDNVVVQLSEPTQRSEDPLSIRTLKTLEGVPMNIVTKYLESYYHERKRGERR